jgi:hypothetical protein
VEDTKDIDNSNASKCTEEDFLSDKVSFNAVCWIVDVFWCPNLLCFLLDSY